MIVALIMLLLLTIIGLSSMRGTSLQENMASNMRDSNLALQASEAVQRKGADKARELLEVLDIDQLEAGVTGSYDDFPGTSKDPEYAIKLLEAPSSSNTEIGVIVYEKLVVLIESEGYGATTNSSDAPSSVSKIRSTYTIKWE